MRLIDANGSYTLNATDNTGHSLCFGGGIISIMDIRGHCVCEFFSDDAPTVDAVKVVRCKDCDWHSESDGVCTNPKCGKSWYGCPVPDEHYCSYGEWRRA